MEKKTKKIFSSFSFIYFYLPILLVIIFFSVTFSFVLYQIKLETNKKILTLVSLESKKYQNSINVLLSKKLNQVIDVAQYMETYNLLPEYKRREIFNHYLYEVAYSNDDIYSIWAVFKPFSIDRFDKDYANPEDNITGQYAYTLYKVKQHIDIKNVDNTDYDKLQNNIHYFEINQKAIIIAPIEEPNYELTGVKYVLRFLAPVFSENEIIGIVGIDVDYKYLSKFFLNNDVTLINDNFDIIYSNNVQKVGHNFFDLYVSLPNIDDIYSKFSLKNDIQGYGKFIYPEKVYYNVNFFNTNTNNEKWGIINIKSKSIKKELNDINIITLIVFFVIGIIVIIKFLNLFLNTIQKFFYEQRDIQKNLFLAKKLKINQEKRINIFNELNTSSAKIRENIELILKYLRNLKQEKYDFEVKLEDNNILREPLEDLLIKLKEDKRVYEEQIAKQEIDSLITRAVAKVNDILRENINDLSKFTYETIKYLSEFIDSVQGGFYIVYDEENEKYLQLEAFYSYNRRVYHKKKIEFGEGMAGICALERKKVFSKVPDDYLEITSGLGKEKPNYVLLIPLEYNNIIYGILEFAFIHKIKEHFSNFLDTVSPIIASTIATIKNNEQNKILLERTQKIQESTEFKEKELEEQLKNLTKIQTESKRLELHSSAVFDSITSVVFYAEFDNEAHILNLNDKLSDAVEFTFVEATLLTYYELFRITDFKKHQKYWTEVLKGERVNYEFQVLLATKTVYIKAVLAPVYNIEGEISKVLFLGIDYSDLRKKEQETRELVDEMSEKAEQISIQEKEMNDFFEEYEQMINENNNLKSEVDKMNKTNEFLQKELEKRVNRSKRIQNNLNKKIKELENELRKLKGE